MDPLYTSALITLYNQMANLPLAEDAWQPILATILDVFPISQGLLSTRDAATWRVRRLAGAIECPGPTGVPPGEFLELVLQVSAPLYCAGNEPALMPLADRALPLAPYSRLGWPLLSGAVVVGVLLFVFPGPATLTPDGYTFLEIAARQLGWALEINGLRQQDSRRTLLLDINTAISRKVASILDFDTLLQETVLLLQSLLHHHLAAIFLLSGDRHDLELVAVAGRGALGKMTGYRQAVQVGLVGRCFRTVQPVLVNNVQLDRDYLTGDVAETRSELDVPICCEDQVLGVLTLTDTEVGGFAADDLLVAQAVADQVALSIRNARLHAELREQAIRDPLTGLYNRRYFVEKLRRMSPGAAVVIMLDVDGLKEANDVWGHAAGDSLLQAIGQLLHEQLDCGAVLARLGGDEFAVLLPAGQARRAMGWVRALVARANAYNSQRPPFPITFSIGVAARRQDESLAETLRRADRRMYLMKQLRRKDRRPELIARGARA